MLRLFLLVSIALQFSCTSGRYGEGVPLHTFAASDGSYFPPFVERFFDGADYYTSSYPDLAQARSGIRLIQVKRLNKGKVANQNESNLSWSADGVYLSYETIAGTKRKIQIKNLMGDYSNDLLVLPKGKNNFLNGMLDRSIHSYNAGLSWSRDSTRFAFMSNGGVGVYNIYVGAVGSQEKPVARSTAKDGYANWNPQMNELAFVSGRSGNGDKYALNMDSKKLSRLTSHRQVDLFPDWFPDGKKLVFCGGYASNHDIFVVRKEKAGRWGQPQKVTSWGRDDLRPTISPDGKLIAFYANSRNGRRSAKRQVWNIHVIPYVPGKIYGPRDLEHTVVATNVIVDLNTGPAWTPDSRKIFYVKHEPKVFNPIYGYDLYSGQTYRLDTKTRMNRDILMSSLGILSFRAQDGVWDRVYLALTNQGSQLQTGGRHPGRILYIKQQKG